MRLVASIFFIGDVLSSLRFLGKDRKSSDTLIIRPLSDGYGLLARKDIHVGYEFFARILPVPKRLLLVDIDPGVGHEAD